MGKTRDRRVEPREGQREEKRKTKESKKKTGGRQGKDNGNAKERERKDKGKTKDSKGDFQKLLCGYETLHMTSEGVVDERTSNPVKACVAGERGAPSARMDILVKTSLILFPVSVNSISTSDLTSDHKPYHFHRSSPYRPVQSCIVCGHHCKHRHECCSADRETQCQGGGGLPLEHH